MTPGSRCSNKQIPCRCPAQCRSLRTPCGFLLSARPTQRLAAGAPCRGPRREFLACCASPSPAASSLGTSRSRCCSSQTTPPTNFASSFKQAPCSKHTRKDHALQVVHSAPGLGAHFLHQNRHPVGKSHMLLVDDACQQLHNRNTVAITLAAVPGFEAFRDKKKTETRTDKLCKLLL